MSETQSEYHVQKKRIVTILGPNGVREVEINGEPGEVIRLEEGERIISQDPVGGIQYWMRAAITQGQLMRLRSIALNLANIVYQEHKDANIRAEIAELRRLLNSPARGGSDAQAES